MTQSRWAIVAIVVAAIGCGDGGGGGGDSGPRADAGDGLDASPGPDAGGEDADAGEGADGGGGDAGIGADGSTGSDGGSDGGGPVSMPCTAVGACDPFDPTSCGAQVCRTGTMGIACYDATTPAHLEGETCTAPAQCVAGTICLDFGAGFHCERMCPAGSIGACGEDRACIGTIGDECVQICRPFAEPCDIYAQDCVDPADTCTLARHPETTAPYTACRPAGPRASGQTCGGGEGACGNDLICISASGVTACRQPCDPAAVVDECATGEACTGMSRTWGVGYCVPTAP